MNRLRGLKVSRKNHIRSIGLPVHLKHLHSPYTNIANVAECVHSGELHLGGDGIVFVLRDYNIVTNIQENNLLVSEQPTDDENKSNQRMTSTFLGSRQHTWASPAGPSSAAGPVRVEASRSMGPEVLLFAGYSNIMWKFGTKLFSAKTTTPTW